jgi:glycosyltransferase involved in cell wall biosynthesis
MFNAAEFSKKYKLPFHLIEKFGMRFYKYMLPYSDMDQAKALKMNSNIKTRIVPQGVDDIYLQNKQVEPQFILFLGRFDIAQKGIDLLIQAYEKVKNRIQYKLIIAGHGPDEEKIKKIITDAGLESKVGIFGSAYGEKKLTLMSQALYTAFPSRHDEMCLWALESLAGGLPLVGFDLPESKWMTQDVALKAPKYDINAYSDLLLDATKPEVIEPMRKSSREFAKNYSWTHVITEFESFIAEVLAIETKTV